MLWVALSAAGFGSMAIFAKLAYAAGVDLQTMLFLRFSIAGIAMCGLMLATRRRWPRGRDLLTLVLLGGVGYVGQSYCYFASLQHASAGVTALLLYLYPALVALLGWLFLRRPLSMARSVAIALALIGTAMTVLGALHSTPLGMALGAGAALIYAVYILIGEGVTPRVGSVPASTVIICAAAVVYGVAWASGPADLPGNVSGWVAVVAIAILSTLVAILFFFVGLGRLGAADASTVSTLEPLATIALAAVFLDERLSAMQIIGGAIIVAAVVLIARVRDGAPRAARAVG